MRYIHHAPQGPVGPVLADVAGGNPASGAYRYYALDHLGSTNGLYDGAKAKVAALAYTPYGASYGDVGPGPLPRYTGHLWDGAAGLHLAPYRAYAPTLARWLSRDPLGMVDGPNVYGYVKATPVMMRDALGLACDDDDCSDEIQNMRDRCAAAAAASATCYGGLTACMTCIKFCKLPGPWCWVSCGSICTAALSACAYWVYLNKRCSDALDDALICVTNRNNRRSGS